MRGQSRWSQTKAAGDNVLKSVVQRSRALGRRRPAKAELSGSPRIVLLVQASHPIVAAEEAHPQRTNRKATTGRAGAAWRYFDVRVPLGGSIRTGSAWSPAQSRPDCRSYGLGRLERLSTGSSSHPAPSGAWHAPPTGRIQAHLGRLQRQRKFEGLHLPTHRAASVRFEWAHLAQRLAEGKRVVLHQAIRRRAPLLNSALD